MIRWTTREWKLIAQKLLDREVEPNRHGWRGHLIEAMQAALPKDRWREPHSLNTAKETLAPMMQALKASPAPATSLSPPEPKPEPPRAEVLSTEELLVELARRIARLLEPKSESSLVDRGFHPPRKHDPNPPREERTAKKKVLIVGPMGQQQQRLVQQFPLLDLRFCNVEDRPEDVYVKGVHCNEVILWTRFMSHAQQDQAKLTNKPTWYANGLEEIEARLRSLHG